MAADSEDEVGNVPKVLSITFSREQPNKSAQVQVQVANYSSFDLHKDIGSARESQTLDVHISSEGNRVEEDQNAEAQTQGQHFLF